MRTTQVPAALGTRIESDRVVMRETNFNGIQTLEADDISERTNEVSSPPRSFTLRTTTYFRMPDARTVLYDGVIDGDADRDEPGSMYRVKTFDPAYRLRFDLAPGDSYTQAYQIEDDLTNAGSPGTINYYDANTTVRYVGRETITVPAGTFVTCKIERQETYESGNAPPDVRTLWLGVGNGLLIRENVEAQRGAQTVNFLTELLQAAIDGEPVRAATPGR